MIAIKTSQSAVDLATWKYFQKVLEYLTLDGMSSEEEGIRKVGDRTVPVFLVKLCTWRAEEISTYLRYIDNAAENSALRSTRGSKSLPRFKVEEESTTAALIGLPRKMYNPTWLANQEREKPYYVKEILQISEEAFDLLVLATHRMNNMVTDM